MTDRLLYNNVLHSSVNACVVDTTPPTFSGITSATPQANGSIEAGWAAATDATSPIGYAVYVALGSVSAASLFVSTNLHSIIRGTPLSTRLFTLANRTTYLANGQIYTLGVRAIDAVNNQDTNVAILTATSTGVVPDCFSAALATFNTYNSNLATQISLLTTQVTSITTAASSIAASASSLATSATSISSSASSLVTSASSIASSATNIATSASSLASSATSIASSSTSLLSSATSIASTATALATTASAIAATETLLAADVVTLSSQLTTLASDLTTLAGYLTSLGVTDTSLAASAASIAASAAALLVTTKGCAAGTVKGQNVSKGTVTTTPTVVGIVKDC